MSSNIQHFQRVMEQIPFQQIIVNDAGVSFQHAYVINRQQLFAPFDL